MPRVSIIMPTYNRAWIIERAITSVLRQTFGDFELIIVDDGSTDDTLEVLHRFADSRVVVIRAAHKGASAARNCGIARARGEFIAYLDTDNVWHENFLEVMTCEFGDADQMLYSGENLLYVKRAPDGSGPRVLRRKTRTPEFDADALRDGNYIDINCAVHRTSMFEAVGTFNEELHALEDWDLFSRAAVAFPHNIRYINQVMCDYYYYDRDSAETVTNQNFNDDMMGFFGLTTADSH